MQHLIKACDVVYRLHYLISKYNLNIYNKNIVAKSNFINKLEK